MRQFRFHVAEKKEKIVDDRKSIKVDYDVWKWLTDVQKVIWDAEEDKITTSELLRRAMAAYDSRIARKLIQNDETKGLVSPNQNSVLENKSVGVKRDYTDPVELRYHRILDRVLRIRDADQTARVVLIVMDAFSEGGNDQGAVPASRPGGGEGPRGEVKKTGTSPSGKGGAGRRNKTA
jgi:hypothetical protein